MRLPKNSIISFGKSFSCIKLKATFILSALIKAFKTSGLRNVGSIKHTFIFSLFKVFLNSATLL